MDEEHHDRHSAASTRTCTSDTTLDALDTYIVEQARTSSGFGEVLVQTVLARGDRVIATARSLGKNQHFLQSEHSENVRLLELDVVAGEEALKGIITKAVAFWGRIDVLVNNAGNGAKGILEEAGSAQMRLQYEANVFGTLDVTTAVLPYMRAQRSGTIVMICSRSTWKPELPGIGVYNSCLAHCLCSSSTSHAKGLYASSKAALRCLSETLAVEVAPFSIRVLIAEPAAFRTNTFANTPYYTANQITDYDVLRGQSQEWYERMHRSVTGDPKKAMRVLTDVVKGEGAAAGRPWPLYLALGDVAVHGITDKCQTMLNVVEEWRDVSTALDMNPSA
ncbi:hypothetical protein GGX14DRAFT_694922 [Mycena pura]|uniref:NAD(P)-binding protein n=1 Tax=Mycena pura TaxID=153505 RepID=A0AAD6YHM8_9AGAR|nr:hypothetical protein GGX14DRAFT_694922 [Mycena pura]